MVPTKSLTKNKNRAARIPHDSAYKCIKDFDY